MRKRENIDVFSHSMAFKMAIFMGIVLNAVLFLGSLHNLSRNSLEHVRLIYVFITNFIELYLLYTFSFNMMKKSGKHLKNIGIRFYSLFY